MRARILTAALGLIGSALVAAPAWAAPAVDGEFALPAGQTVGSNNEIVEGPDGNMWVTTEQNAVVRIKPDGTVEGPFSTTNSVTGITVGPDGNLWASSAIGAVKIPPTNPAGAQAYTITGFADGRGITAGPDGKLWAAGGDDLVSFTTADPEGSADLNPIADMMARGMDTGGDGLLWIADQSGRVLSATAAADPVVTPFAVGGGVQDVGAGPNAQVAYVNPGGSPQSVGRLTPGGAPQVTESPASDPFGTTFAPDGAYWIARANTNDLLRLTPDGATTTLTGFAPSGGVGPRKIATGPNDTLWVTLDTPEKVARVTGVEPPSAPPGGGTQTTLDKGPKRKVKTSRKKAKVKFKFSSSDPAAIFECSLKRPPKQANKAPAKLKPCTSPRKYKLKPGKYTFQVRATVGGFADETPARHKFKVVRDRD